MKFLGKISISILFAVVCWAQYSPFYDQAKCDLVIDGSPVNLDKLLKINKPIITLSYEVKERGKTKVETILGKLKVRKGK